LQAVTLPQTTISSQPILTIEDQHKYYYSKQKLALRLGLSLEWFVGEFGTEEKWMAQFTAQSYDSNGG
jgi:hypothetical protein